ncbi:MAG: chromate transporter [Lachnospiraceae bacterium]|nr:chromate transporter [Lachnospiraceae bacterium]
MILLTLFTSFLQIGAFSFGGGYAAMPLIQEQVITRHGWLTMSDFTDLVTVAEMTPGPIAVNGATFVGNQVAGIPGAIAATIGVILPSCIFVTVLAWLYTRYRRMRLMQGVLQALRPAVVSMIFTAGLTILLQVIFKEGIISFALSDLQIRGLILFITALAALRIKKANPILVMVCCGVAEPSVTKITAINYT